MHTSVTATRNDWTEKESRTARRIDTRNTSTAVKDSTRWNGSPRYPTRPTERQQRPILVLDIMATRGLPREPNVEPSQAPSGLMWLAPRLPGLQQSCGASVRWQEARRRMVQTACSGSCTAIWCCTALQCARVAANEPKPDCTHHVASLCPCWTALTVAARRCCTAPSERRVAPRYATLRRACSLRA